MRRANPQTTKTLPAVPRTREDRPRCTLRTDPSRYYEALRELKSLIDAARPPNAIAVVVIRALLGLYKSPDELIAFSSEVVTTVDAVKQIVFFEPSDRLVRVLAALRTQDWDFLARCHPSRSDLVPDADVEAVRERLCAKA